MKSFLARLLYERTLALLVVLFCLSAGAFAWHFSRFSTQVIRDAALEGTALTAQALEEVRTLYTSEVVERVRPGGVPVTHDYLSRAGAIPLPATFSMALAERIGAHGTGLRARLYSDYPFPWRRAKGGPRDDFERSALAALRRFPDVPYYRFEELQGRPVLRFAKSDLMRPSCIACHNSHPASPKTDWKVGDVRGVLEVIRPLDILVAQSRASLAATVAVAGGVGAAALAGLALVFARLEGVSAELEARVRERTAELSAANAELESFSYSVSHDLRAPLRHIDGFLSLVLRRSAARLEKRDQQDMAAASASARRLGALVDDLLNFSRMGRAELRRTAVPLGALLEEVRAELGARTRGREVEWRFAKLPAVEGDPALLKIVFTNLFENALKFTRPRRKAVIEAGWRPHGKGQAAIFVRDNGVGFDMAHVGGLFGVFRRLHRQAEFEGTGIGLANVRRIVHRHGGETWAEGAPDKGATIHVSLPLARKARKS